MSEENEKTIASYEQAYEKYLSSQRSTPASHIKSWLEDAVQNLKQSAKILEIGSAGGVEAKYLESLGYSVIRSDAAKAFVKHLHDQGFECLSLNAITDTFPSNCDLIFANAVLLHFSKDEAVNFFTNCHEALTANGILALTTKKGDGQNWQLNKLGLPRFENYWQPQQLTDCLTEAGFQVTSLNEERSQRQEATWIDVIAHKSKS